MSDTRPAPAEEIQHRILDEKLGGDGLEKPLWNLIGDKFPKYETFWSEFVWPVTNRIYGEHPNRKAYHLRAEVTERCPDLIWLAQAHYCAFARYGSLYLRIHNWPFNEPDPKDPHVLLKAVLHQDRFQDVYLRFIGVDDMISTMASTILRLREAAGIEKLPAVPSEEKALTDFQKWLRGRGYKKSTDAYTRTGAPIIFHLTHRGSDLRHILPGEVFARYDVHRKRVARYRNLFHNPHPTQMMKGDRHLVPKPDKLPEYRLWPDMASINLEEHEQDFESAETALAADLGELTEILDNIWTTFIANMRAVSATEVYRGWLAKSPDQPDLPVTQEGLTQFIGPVTGFETAATSTVADLPIGLSAVADMKPKSPGRFGV